MAGCYLSSYRGSARYMDICVVGGTASLGLVYREPAGEYVMTSSLTSGEKEGQSLPSNSTYTASFNLAHPLRQLTRSPPTHLLSPMCNMQCMQMVLVCSS